MIYLNAFRDIPRILSLKSCNFIDWNLPYTVEVKVYINIYRTDHEVPEVE